VHEWKAGNGFTVKEEEEDMDIRCTFVEER
jgi:hypothetical protein